MSETLLRRESRDWRLEKERLEKERLEPLKKEGFTIREFCHVTSLGRSSVYKVLKTGELAAQKLGRRTIILQQELLRFLAALPPANEVKQPRVLDDRPETLNKTASAPRPVKVNQRPAVASKAGARRPHPAPARSGTSGRRRSRATA
jgi:excisionase family DNA binding protein